MRIPDILVTVVLALLAGCAPPPAAAGREAPAASSAVTAPAPDPVVGEVIPLPATARWVLEGGVCWAGDELVFTGDPSGIVKAEVALPPALSGTWYLVADFAATGVRTGSAHWHVPKLRLVEPGPPERRMVGGLPLRGDHPWRPNALVWKRQGTGPASVQAWMERSSGTWRLRNIRLQRAVPPAASAPWEEPAAPRCILDLAGARRVPFNNALLGLNAHFFSDGGIGWGDPAVASLVDRAAPSVLRFPGGSVANWYDWRSDRLQTGWAPERIVRDWGLGEGRGGGFSAYAGICRARGLDSIQVFNVLREDPASAAERLRAAIAAGCRPRWIELGNENYDVLQQGGAVSSAATYLAQVRRVRAALREVDPGIPCSVNIDDAGSAWTQELAASPADFDAVTIHNYPYLPQADPTGIRLWLGALNADAWLDDEMGASHKLFPGKPLLLSEWGMIVPSAQSGSHLAALGGAAMFTVIADHGSDGPVAMAAQHIFWGNFLGLWYRDRTGAMVQRPYAAVFALLSRAFRGGELYRVRPAGDELTSGVPAVAARAVRRPDGRLAVLAVNKTRQPATLTLRAAGLAADAPWRMSALVPTDDPLRASSLSAASEPLVASSGSGDPRLPPLSVALVEW